MSLVWWREFENNSKQHHPSQEKLPVGNSTARDENQPKEGKSESVDRVRYSLQTKTKTMLGNTSHLKYHAERLYREKTEFQATIETALFLIIFLLSYYLIILTFFFIILQVYPLQHMATGHL